MGIHVIFVAVWSQYYGAVDRLPPAASPATPSHLSRGVDAWPGVRRCDGAGYTLDVAKAADLHKMRVTVALSFVSIVYSRVLRFAYVGYKLAMTFYTDGSA